ncbi:spore germination protein [Paenibacillus koleovorans]|uniref:spore germination protein n=1 Tax=Paenibacillus koleovorans TaxID=121608 RepID=UPI000FDADFAA|nr:spore germination protein [Paenibacillus koleovorans]
MSKDPNAMAAYLKKKFAHNTDFSAEELDDERGKAVVCYLSSLVEPSHVPIHLQYVRWDKPRTLASLGGKIDLSKEELEHEILGGRLVVLHARGNASLQLKTRNVSRSVEGPQSESAIESSEDAFTEGAITNLGILRSHLQSSDLIISTVALGTIRKRCITVCYMRSMDGEKLAPEVIELLSTTQSDVSTIQDLAKVLKQRRWGPVPLFTSTQLPEQGVKFLLEGRIVLFLDQHPYALVAPPSITDMWCALYDRNHMSVISLSIVALRVLGILIALTVPGLYVALVSINPELLDIDIALAVARSREGVPYPALIEMLLMGIVIDMVGAATIHLPKSFGPTLTMVGGIMLGQAAVQAQLVSNLLLIVLSATIIANYNIIGIQNMMSLRLFKYLNIALGAILGIVGMLTGIVFFVFYLAGVSTFRRPYLRTLKEAGEEHD